MLHLAISNGKTRPGVRRSRRSPVNQPCYRLPVAYLPFRRL